MARATVGSGRGGRKLKPSLNSKLTRFARSVPGIVGTSIIEGIGGPKARAAKGAVRLGMRATSQAINKSAGGKRVVTRATMPGRSVRTPKSNKPAPKVSTNRSSATRQQIANILNKGDITVKQAKAIADKLNARTAVVKSGSKVRINPNALNQKKAPVRKTKKDIEAGKVAAESVRSPYGRTRAVAKPNSGRGLSKSEKARDTYYKSNQNPVTKTQGKPKPKRVVSKAEKEFIRRQEIRKAISGKPGKRAPEVAEKESKPLRSIQEVLAPLKGKKVVVNKDIKGKEVRMDAEEYVLTRANFRAAGRNPENSVAARTRAQQKSRADAAEAKAIKDARKEELVQRRREIIDAKAALANPRRYSSPSKEYGNVRQTEGLIAKGEKRIQEETARRRIEQEKIARTPKRKKQVEATLQRAKDREAAIRARQRVKDSDAGRRLKVKPNRRRRNK
jgi:hypothetical protein